jgi:myxalamid-type polyketide synthase MxaD
MADLNARLSGLSPEKRALLEKRLRQSASAQADAAHAVPLAIVGIGCRFPGGANSPEAFWKLLADGVDAVGEVPPDRWNTDELYDPDPDAPGKVSTRWGGFIDAVDRFDAALFSIAPREAVQMDPQQRLLLETAWAAFEHGGLAPDRLKGSRTGVFVGVHSHSSDYCLMQLADPDRLDAFSASGTAHNVLSGRLSYLLDLRGPSLVVDTACSSSLVAVHLACQSLRAGECTMAVAAGVNLMLVPPLTVASSRMHMLSPDGRCKTFDERANGFVRSEGCGVVIIKRLSDALDAGDRVLAVIRGSAINQDGRTNGLTAPSGLAQEAVVREALKSGGVDPARIGYVEAHGTGTPLGDPIEVEALAAVFSQPRPDGDVLMLGSAKSNIGHLEGAAGIAGLIKAALSLHYEQVPPLVHFRRLNPHLSLDGTPFLIPTALSPWPRVNRPRFAGVSSFGWSGTNAHVVLEEAPALGTQPQAGVVPDGTRMRLLPFSARTTEALETLGHAWHEWASGAGAETSAADMCHSAAFRRAHHECRAAIVGTDMHEWRERLGALAANESHPQVAVGRTGERLGIVFVFPGQGSQWIGMGRELYATEPVFRESIDRTAQAIAPLVDWSLTEQISGDAEQSRLHEIHVVQPTLFAVEIALAALWRSWGIEPDAVVGHSMGEVAAACVAGALTIEDAARVICLRSQLLRRVRGKGGMAAVELSLEDTARAIAGYETRLSIAVSNSPSSTVISGDVDAIDEVLASLQERDVFCRPIKVDVASHSPQVDVLRDDLMRALDGLAPRAAAVPIYSTVTATVTTGAEFDPEYWTRNLRQPVLLSKAVERLTADGHLTFIEMSPHPVLLPAIETTLRALQQDGLVLPSLRRDEREREVLLTSVARLYVAGYDPDWMALNGPGAFVELPGYQYQRERYWLEVGTARAVSGLVPSGSSAHPILSNHVDLADPPGARLWQFALDGQRLRYLFDHRLENTAVLPASLTIEIALAAGAQLYGDGPITIRDFELLRPLPLSSEAAPPVIQVTAVPRGDGRAELKIFAVDSTGLRLLVRGNVASSETTVSTFSEIPSDTAPMSDDTFYAQLESRGVSIGDGLRSIASVSRSAAGAVARLAVADTLSRDLARYRCHPAITDGLLQLTAAGLEDDRGLYMPSRFREVRWHRQPALRTAATVERVEGDPLRQNLRLSHDGAVCLEILGVELHSLERTTAAHAPERIEEWLYEVEWKDVEIEEQSTVKLQQRQERWIVFADRAGVGQAIAGWLGRKGQQVTIVNSADQFGRDAQGRVDVRPDHDEDYRSLLDEVCGHDQASCRGIVFTWPIDIAEPHDAASLSAAFDRGTTSALRLVHAVASHQWAESPRVWFVTQGAQAINGAAPAVAQSPLWGLGRVIAEEHSDMFGGLVDLDPEASLDAAAAQLGSAMSAHDGELEVGWRNGRRLVPRLVRSSVPRGRLHRWRPDATYVVSGAFGGVGLAIARGMVEQGARRLILIGRSALPPRDMWSVIDESSPAGRRVAAVKALEALGASVHLATLDVADETAVTSYFDAFEREGWPQIRGVVHCAAVTDDKLLGRVDAASLLSVLRPKAIGAWVLDKRLRRPGLDCFVSFSSLGSLIGRAGQGSYAASNAFLDAFAARQHGDGCHAVSINWAGWRGLGFAATEGGERTIAELEARGFATFTAQQGLEAMHLILARDVAQVAVVPADWARFRASRVAANELRILDELLKQLDTPVGTPEVSGSTSFRATLLATEPALRREALERHLQEHLAQVLRLPLSRLDPVKPLGSLGLESLMALEFRNRLEKALGVKLSATLVWNHPTIRTLATYLSGRLEIPLDVSVSESTVEAATATTAAVALEKIGELSEDEALRALLGVQH